MVKRFFGILRMIRLVHWTFARFCLEILDRSVSVFDAVTKYFPYPKKGGVGRFILAHSLKVVHHSSKHIRWVDT